MASTPETTRVPSRPEGTTAEEEPTPILRQRRPDTLRRERRDGPLNAALKDIIEIGNLLALDGGTLGVDDRWREQHAAWRSQSTQILRENFELEAAAEFLHATQATLGPGAACPTDTSEIRAIRNGTELLTALRSTLSGQGSER
jgi:hypothetical protein